MATPGVFGPNTTAHVCPRCAGVLADWKTAQPFFTALGVTTQDLQTLVKQAARVQRPTPPPPCTACGKGTMKAFTLKATELDLCEDCGTVWLDRGELARVTQGKLGAQAPQAPQKVAGLREETVGVYEMFWDCAFCGTKALLGKSNRFCPKCGAPQDPTRRYFPPEGQEVKANTEYEGADKACPACQVPNGAKANNCKHCGSPMDGSREVARVADQVKGALTPAAAGKPQGPLKKQKWPWIAGAVVALMCTFCGVAALWKKDVNIEVAGHRWAREIDVESLKPKADSSWCDSRPADAYDISKRREQRSTKQIPDGEECSTRNVDRGDGTFERRRECRTKYRDEPVYDDKCYYTVDRWQLVRTAKSGGKGVAPEPAWPAVNLTRTGTCIGCEREGPRRETYTLDLAGEDGKTYDCSVPMARWHGVKDGTKKPVKVGVITGIADCDTL